MPSRSSKQGNAGKERLIARGEPDQDKRKALHNIMVL
jgi:hypothetical protein